MSHHVNQLLSKAYDEDLHIDEKQSAADIMESLQCLQKQLNEPGFILTSKEIGRISRQLHAHSLLKYPFTNELLEMSLEQFSKVYSNPGLTYGMKAKVLRTLQLLFRKAKHRDDIKFYFNYQPLWEEAIRMLARADRLECTASESVFSDLLSQLPLTLHAARRFISFDNEASDALKGNICAVEVPALERDAAIDRLMNKAMSMLQHINFPACCEGLLLMIDCLPNDHKKYAEMVPKWIEKWAEIGQNTYWDCCWLTLLCRARKYCPAEQCATIPWKSYLPFLFSKAKELTCLPLASGSASLDGSDWPFTIKYHAKLLTIPYDVKQMALKKLAKMIHFICLALPSDGLVPAVPAGITSPSACFPPEGNETSEEDPLVPYKQGAQEVIEVLPGAVDIVMFLHSIRSFFNPSTQGGWSQLLAYFQTSLVLQLCRHVGHRVANVVYRDGKLNSVSFELLEAMNVNDATTISNYLPPIHVKTVQYLFREIYLPIALEQLYAKSPMLSQCAISCIKNIVSIEPVLGHRVLRFLLSALNPSAISQPHQTPVAMRTISSCFHSLLYPYPIILSYLQNILQLSLDGVDASDNGKTLVTLDMYSTIFGWIPLLGSSSYCNDSGNMQVPSFLVLAGIDAGGVQKVDTDHRLSITVPQDLQQYMAEEWAPALLEKIFAVLEAQEAPKENTQKSPIPSAIGQCVTHLFQAMAPYSAVSNSCSTSGDDPQAILRAALQGKVMQYFSSNTPINAVKSSAKIYEAMLSADPNLLSMALPPLLDEKVLSLKCSHEKVAFRLRLAGGACRGALGSNIFKEDLCEKYITPVVTSDAFYNHTEKGVREATRKLLKDTLKGATSFYPIAVQPNYTFSAEESPPGSPNDTCPRQLQFHTPSNVELSTAVKLLRLVIGTIIKDVKLQVSGSVSADGGSMSAAQLKKDDELLINRMWLMEKCLRGAAEILGDVDLKESDGDDAPGEEEEGGFDSSRSCYVLKTGRDKLLKSLDADEQSYLQSLRVEVLQFLHFLQEKIQKKSKSDSATQPDAMVDSASEESAAVGNVFNNDQFQQAWLQCLNLVITRRMACLKDVDSIRKMMKISTKNGRTAVTNVLYKKIKMINGGEWSINADISDNDASVINYWHYHDTTTVSIACNVWMQHIVRVKELSFNSVKRYVNTRAKNTDPFMRCLVQVVGLCQHEYDKIRGMTTKSFDLITGRFSITRLTGLIEDIIAILQQPAAVLNFPTVHGMLCLLEHSRIMKRIISDVFLSERLLRTLMQAEKNLLIDEVTVEQDKRKRLADRVTEAILKYAKKWDAPPLCALKTSKQKDAMIKLVEFTFTGTRSALEGTAADEAGSNAASGLRFQSFAAYFMLHQLGRDFSALGMSTATLVPARMHQSKPLWEWILTALTSGQNQPVQIIALTALSRLVRSFHKYFNKDSEVDQSVLAFLQYALSPSSEYSRWTALIKGLSQTYPQRSDDGSSAQWSRGIKPILLATKFLKVAFPRHSLSIPLGGDRFLSDLYKDNSCVFLDLVRTGALDSVTTGSVLKKENLLKLFSLFKDVMSSAANESETRCLHALKSDLFAAVLRYYRTIDFERNGISHEMQDTQQLLVDMLQKSFDELSTDYFCAWEDAIYFAFECNQLKWLEPVVNEKQLTDATDNRDQLLVDFILNQLRNAIARKQSVNISNGNGSDDGVQLSDKEGDIDDSKHSEGFAGQMKAINLASSLLMSSFSASYLHCASDHSESGGEWRNVDAPVILNAVRSILLDTEASLTSPYRTVRSSIASLLYDVIEVDARSSSVQWKETVSALCFKLLGEPSRHAKTTDGVDETGATTNAYFSDGVERQVCESVCFLLDNSCRSASLWMLADVIGPLLEMIVNGSGKFITTDVTVSKLCHKSAVSVANFATRTDNNRNSLPSPFSEVGQTDLLKNLLRVCQTVIEHSPKQSADNVAGAAATTLHARETVMKMLTVMMVNNWTMLNSEEERKIFKDAFSKGIADPKPEIQTLAQAGMIEYLGFKQPNELATIAAVYTKNSEVYAAREKKRKRQVKNGDEQGTEQTVKLDPAHSNTVYMMACVIMCTPYDLPGYLPSLLSSFVRHMSIPSLRDVIIRTVQMFKRTHQDRWEEDFKQLFTSEQLAELQGTGAAHYYS